MNKTTAMLIMLSMVAFILTVSILSSVYIITDANEVNDSQVATIVTIGAGFSAAVFGLVPIIMAVRDDIADYHKQVNGHMAELAAANKTIDTAAGNVAGRAEQLAEQAAVKSEKGEA